MKNNSAFLFKDTLIIFFIILVFIAVILVFITEIIKNNDIRSSRNNFFFVKEEILQSINKCNKNLEKKWVFGGLCSQVPVKENISRYFNTIQKITNPYDDNDGVEGGAGSVLIEIKSDESQFILSVDIDANGGIDIQQKIKY